MLTPGTRLGPYEIVSLIGSGGMGEVYRALDVRLSRHVAIKLPSKAVENDPDLRLRFEREARAAAALSHPHICAIFDIGRDGETPFLVMEYLDGETLAHRLSAGSLPIPAALDIAAQIADAVTEAHQQGLIHRDLKPSNVMLARSGAKVLDFGVAKFDSAVFRSATDASTVLDTDRRTIVGTLQYMSPEQLEGREVDSSSDVFSFGALLYEMVTGSAAHGAMSEAGVIAAILERNPTPPRTLVPAIPAELNDLILDCLAKDPSSRPTAGNLVTRLRAIVADDHQHVQHHTITPTMRPIRSLAVLPLAASLKQEAEDAFAAGMVDGLIDGLAVYPRLRVISRMSSQRFATDPMPIRRAIQELHVDGVVGIEVREPEAGRLAIDVELIEAAMQSRVWSGHFSCERSEVLQVQGQIAHAIAQKLRAGSAKGKVARQRPVLREAHEHYLKGTFLFENKIGNWLDISCEHFMAALKFDGTFAPAHAALSRCYVAAALRALSSETTPRFIHNWRQALDKAEAEARLAIKSDHELAAGHSTLAQVLWCRWRFAEAEQAFRKALALNPNDPNGHKRYSLFLNIIGRAREGIVHARLGRELDPLATDPCLAIAFYAARDFAACIRCCEEGLDVDPHAGFLLYYRGVSEAFLGDLDASLATLAIALAELGDDCQTLAAMAAFHAKRGELNVAGTLLNTLRERHDDPVSVAEVFAAMGKPHDALDELERAFVQETPNLLNIGCDPMFDSLRDRPRFRRLLVGTGLAQYLGSDEALPST